MWFERKAYNVALLNMVLFTVTIYMYYGKFSLQQFYVNIHEGTATPDNNRDECGVRDSDRDTDCPDGSICLLDGVINRCVTSKFLYYQHYYSSLQ